MKKRLIYALCLFLVFLLAQAVEAQQPTPKYSSKDARADYKRKIDIAQAKLQKMEDLLNKIETNKVFLKGEMSSMDTDLDQYGNDMWNLYNEAVGRVKEASETEGKRGGHSDFLYFEDIAQDHGKRLKALGQRHQRIENDVLNGKIKPGKDIIDTMTPQERDEFKKSLTPEGRKEIEKAYPKMRGSFRAPPAAKEFAFNTSSDQVPIPVWPEAPFINDSCSDFLRVIGNFFVPRAEAAEAAICYGACVVAGAWTGGTSCYFCIATYASGLLAQYDAWRSCMKSCSCAWYRFWCCARKTWCTATFVALIA